MDKFDTKTGYEGTTTPSIKQMTDNGVLLRN